LYVQNKTYLTSIRDLKLEARILKIVHGTMPGNDIYVYEVSSNYFHLLKSYAVDKEMLRTDGRTDGNI